MIWPADLAADGSFPLARDGRLPWIESYGISYDLAMDGISMPLVMLANLPGAASCSWARGRGSRSTGPPSAPRCCCSRPACWARSLAYDLFLFYVFWEVMLIPMYLLIGIWGGERRIYAAVKFFLYTMAGSLLMLVAILWLAWTLQGARRRRLELRLRGHAATRLPAATSRSGCSRRSRSPSPSRCRCSRSTPGCRTRTSRRRPAAR